MAFRRTDVDIPEDFAFPESLSELGFTINLHGQVVGSETGKLFKFAVYENDRTNQQRYHAIHKAVRKELHRILAAYDVHLWYMWEGKKYSNVTFTQPTAPSVSILSSPSFSRDEERELYLVVGDSKQDLGVLSRQIITNEGGLYAGSVLGLVAALRGKQMQELAGKSDVAESSLPGMVVCNPGELIWSNIKQECTSAVTWYDQKRETGFSDQYHATDNHNRIRAHENPECHVALCLRAYLTHVAGPKTHVNIITIGDGSANVISYLNAVYAKEEDKAEIANIQIDIAMVSPTHNDDVVTDPALKQFLAKHGGIWESHSLPKGTLLADVAPEFRSFSLLPTTQQADNNEDDVDKLSSALAGVSVQAEGEISLCQRFSAGIENTADMIFPKVMGDVLQFFKEK
jgi:hypothetical protein